MNEQDDVRLRHMLEAAQEAREFAAGRRRSDLDADRMLLRALTQAITIVGEAASRVSREFQESNPQIPWPDIVAMRNWLVHAYFDIDADQVWATVEEDLPPLIVELERLIPPRQGTP